MQRAQLRRASASDSVASLRQPAEAAQVEEPGAAQLATPGKAGSEAMMSGGGVRPVIATGAGSPPGGCSLEGVEVRLWLEDAEEAGAWYDATSGSDSDPPTPPPQLGSTGLPRTLPRVLDNRPASLAPSCTADDRVCGEVGQAEGLPFVAVGGPSNACCGLRTRLSRLLAARNEPGAEEVLVSTRVSQLPWSPEDHQSRWTSLAQS